MISDKLDSISAGEFTERVLFDHIERGDVNGLRSHAPKVVGDVIFDILSGQLSSRKDFVLRNRAPEGKENLLIEHWNVTVRVNQHVRPNRLDYDKNFADVSRIYTSLMKFFWQLYPAAPELRSYLLFLIDDLEERAAFVVETTGDKDSTAEEWAEAGKKGIFKGLKQINPEWARELEQAYLRGESE